MAVCNGFGRPIGSHVLQPCPYVALDQVDGVAFCHFCAQKMRGLITTGDPRWNEGELSWLPKRGTEDEPERSLRELLLEEWV